MSRPTRHVLPLIVAAACWGLGAVASKRAVAEIPATTLLPIQLAASFGALVVLARASGHRIVRGDADPRLMLLGVLNPGLAYLLSLVGLATITASLSVLLWALEPILVMALAWLMLKDQIRPVAVVFSAAAVVGAAMAGSAGTSGAQVVGVALTIAGVGCCAIYTVATSMLIRDESTLSVVAFQQLAALAFAVSVLVVHALASGVAPLGEASPTAWASAIASGIIYYGIAFWAYVTGLRRTTASTAAIFFNLIPLFGIAGGRLFLGERMGATQLVGAAIVVTTVAALTRVTIISNQQPQTSPRSTGR
jgi:drug/metabolite transporter (DMT)-like permease